MADEADGELMSRLRAFSSESIEKDCRELNGSFDNALFYGCRFEKLNNLTLKDCDLNASTFETSSVRDALGFTLSLSCLSFRGVEFSPLLFDMFLCLATMSKGNDIKREKLLDVVGRERAAVLLRVLKGVE